ncbi:reverse transcriptase [Klebsormidium nitens]|uniref:Reverse transcriptase n=1 Tax=Klebsormidium nitens TaxID=105231 RepID=A0A1Y1IHB7_KLENI|nr:reverse transcriptase [Klebsormidium nitens]|eukprot:GAQ88451.1 reverse transcriptase [Klebsormidium nitens]
MAGPEGTSQNPSQNADLSAAERIAQEAREATLRTEAMFKQMTNQFSAHASAQEATLAKQSEKIDSLQAQLLAKSAPKKSDRVSNPEVKRIMQPMEKAQEALSQTKQTFEAHLDGTSPLAHLSEDQIENLRGQCDEGELALAGGIQFLMDWDSEGLEVASEMVLLREEASKDPAEVSLATRAKKSLAEKRKASEELAKPAKEQKSAFPQNPGRSSFFNRNRSPSPQPGWFHPPQPILVPSPMPAPLPNPVPSPIYQSQYLPPPITNPTGESLHKLADLTDAAEFEGFKDPPKAAAAKSSSKAPEPWLRHRLRRHVQFWRAFVTSSFVMSILLTGYKLPWISSPPLEPQLFRNHPSAFEHSDFVSEAVRTLKVTGTIMPVSEQPFLVSPLGVVPKAEDKLRLILDLRFLNQFLKITKFKYESIRMISDLCQPLDFLFTIDLKAGYHHIDIYEPHWKYLGFQWQGQFYVFTQLPFGLAPACYVFTMVMRQLTKSWRERGYRLVHYIDDFFFACRDSVEFARVQASVLADLAAAGLVVSLDKCQLSSSHVVKFLGFVVDTLFGQFRLTAIQKAKLSSAIQSCLRSPRAVPAKTVARVTGLIQSLSLVTGPISGLFSRFLHRALNSRSSWYSKVSLDSAALSELQFWQSRLSLFHSRDIWRKHSLLRVLYYDAGGNGWGGHLEIGSAKHEAHGPWEPHEVHGITSSTWRELSGLLRLLRAFKPLLSDCSVIARGDALNVFSILSKGGSAKDHLQSICLELFGFCSENRIELRPEWLPREQNARADYLSKIRDVDDFGLSPETFSSVSQLFGPFTVDRFASEHNKKLPCFNSFYWCPGPAAANAFTQDWGPPARNYCFPPPTLVAATIRHARACRARVTLVVLGWRSAPWWPLLCGSVASGRGFAPFVRGQLFFPSARGALVPGYWFNFESWDLDAAGLQSFDPELAALSVDLHDASLVGRAPGTYRLYAGPWRRYKDWCQKKGVSALPSNPLQVALYMMKLLRTANTPAPLKTFSGAVYFNHTSAGLPSPTNHPLVRMAREAARRIKIAGLNQKRPFLASQIRRLFDLWGSPSASLYQLMKLASVTLCYVSLFRYDDLVAIQWQHVKFVGSSHMEIFIPDSKTDQYRTGDTVFVARLGGPYCPVALIQRLLSVGRYHSSGPGSLIRATLPCVPVHRLKDNPPCYNTVLSWFKEAASLLGLDPKLYGTHSGRRGGATGAATNEVSDRLIKRHGRWRSDTAMGLYIRDKLSQKLAVSRNLGLQEDIPIAQLREFEREACLH